MASETECCVFQQLKRFQGCAKLYQHGVFKDEQKAIDKLVSFVLNYVDFRTSESDRDEPSKESRVKGIGKEYIDDYIKEYLSEHDKDNDITVSYMTDECKPVEGILSVIVPNNEEWRIGDDTDKTIYEITVDEITLVIMKTKMEE